MMKEKKPRPYAFCWLKGCEIGKKFIDKMGCIDPEKQIYGVCEHIMFYGDKKTAMDPAAMQRIYDQLIRDLAVQGVRLEGRNMNLVQAMPGGVKVKLPFDEAEKARVEKVAAKRKCM